MQPINKDLSAMALHVFDKQPMASDIQLTTHSKLGQINLTFRGLRMQDLKPVCSSFDLDHPG